MNQSSQSKKSSTEWKWRELAGREGLEVVLGGEFQYAYETETGKKSEPQPQSAIANGLDASLQNNASIPNSCCS